MVGQMDDWLEMLGMKLVLLTAYWRVEQKDKLKETLREVR